VLEIQGGRISDDRPGRDRDNNVTGDWTEIGAKVD
jgi:hypothetical protein